MSVGISGYGLAVPIGGVRVFLENLLLEIVRRDSRAGYKIFHPCPEFSGRFGRDSDILVASRHPLLWEWLDLPRALRRNPVDVLLCPKYLVPWRLPERVQVIAVVHDLAYFPLKGCAVREYKLRDVLYMRLLLRRSLLRADVIVCDSMNTQKDLENLFPEVARKCQVIHLGVRLPAASEISVGRRMEICLRYNLEAPFIFYPGTLSPRKNMVRLLEAFTMIKDRVPHVLVLTGGKSWGDGPVLQAVDRLGLQDRVLRMGSVPEADMPALYAAASALVYPSLYEGFGLPVLEAMSCGCPVLCANTSSLPEVAGEAALQVDPYNPEAIARELIRLLTDLELRDRLGNLGRDRAALFSWERCANSYISLIHELQGATDSGPANLLDTPNRF